MSNDTTQSFFFPDPYNTGEGVSIEAVNLEDALKQLKKRAPKDATQEKPQESQQEQNSAPAPEADESHERTNH